MGYYYYPVFSVMDRQEKHSEEEGERGLKQNEQKSHTVR